MNDLQIRETPNAKPTSSSGAEAKIGQAILDAYRDTQQRSLRDAGFSVAATDYCTFSPDGYGKASFKRACAAHDRCYSSSSWLDRVTCDRAFKTRMNSACNSAYDAWWETVARKECNGVAWVYYQAVRNGAQWAYNGHGDPS